MENKKEIKQSSHSLILENRKKLIINAIAEVLSATDKCVVARTNENTLNIFGKDLRVEKLSLDEGVLVVEGLVDSFKYVETSGKSFFKRLFK